MMQMPQPTYQLSQKFRASPAALTRKEPTNGRGMGGVRHLFDALCHAGSFSAFNNLFHTEQDLI
jgi:hypothetical protein